MDISTVSILGGNMAQTWTLWEHQQEAVDSINEDWKSGKDSICCQLCTGGGKSRIIRTIVDQWADRKKVIYIIAHRSTLVKQLSEELTEAGLQHGIIKAGSPYIKYRVQVCSMQTLVRRLDKLPEPSLIVVDECHHLKSKSYMKILETWKSAKLLGMTATPQRQDGSGMEDIFDVLELGPTMRALIDAGSLSDYDYYAPENIDMSDVHTRAGEYVSKESEEKVDKTVITGNAIEHYKRYADHKPAICSCISIAHSEHVAQEFRDAGYKAIAVNSKMKTYEIDAAINGLRDGSVEILTQCDMLGEGVDIKGAEVLIGLRPTHSLVVFLQHSGRVLRKAPGKEKAIILDHVGNWERFGLPDENRDWSLAGKPKKDKGQSDTKRCPECLRVVPSSTRICPHCGYQWVEAAEVGTRQIEEKEGQLVAIKTVSHMEQQELIRTIACNAHNLKQAISVAKKNGFDHRAGFTIWRKTLKHGINDYVKF